MRPRALPAGAEERWLQQSGGRDVRAPALRCFSGVLLLPGEGCVEHLPVYGRIRLRPY